MPAKSKDNYISQLEKRVSQNLAKLVGGGGEAYKMSGVEGGENWSKLCSLGGRVSTLALILEGEPFRWSKFQPSALLLKRIFWDLNGVGVVKEG